MNKTIPTVSIGLPVYNGERHLRSAVDSLLQQTFTDFELIISDDGSTDRTLDIAKEYVDRDGRVSVVPQKRIGMVENFRAVFAHSKGKYFMWASDHDLWEPEWLQSHVQVLDAHPGVVLAYPLVVTISDDGKEYFKDPRRFQTFGMQKLDRARAASRQMGGAGNMVFGLFRTSNLAKTTVYPRITNPDRLLMLELSVQGTYYQIDKHLWRRRYPRGKPTVTERPSDSEYGKIYDRQRELIFPTSKTPWITQFPILAIVLCLVYRLSIRPSTGSYKNALLGLAMAYWFARARRELFMTDLRIFARRVLELVKK